MGVEQSLEGRGSEAAPWLGRQGADELAKKTYIDSRTAMTSIRGGSWGFVLAHRDRTPPGKCDDKWFPQGGSRKRDDLLAYDHDSMKELFIFDVPKVACVQRTRCDELILCPHCLGVTRDEHSIFFHIGRLLRVTCFACMGIRDHGKLKGNRTRQRPHALDVSSRWRARRTVNTCPALTVHPARQQLPVHVLNPDRTLRVCPARRM